MLINLSSLHSSKVAVSVGQTCLGDLLSTEPVAVAASTDSARPVPAADTHPRPQRQAPKPSILHLGLVNCWIHARQDASRKPVMTFIDRDT